MAKYISLLKSRSLFLTRIDLLGDPAEGRLTRKNWEHTQEDPNKENLARHISKSRKMFYANCWHMNPVESAGMWSIYTSSDKGIAISTTAGELKSLLRPTKQKMYYFGKVNYIDRVSEEIGTDFVFRICVSKGKYYEYENEARIIHWLTNSYIEENSGKTIDSPYNTMEYVHGDKPTPDGVALEIDIDRLIHKIVIAPNTPQWLYDLLISVTQVYGFDTLLTKFQWSSMKEEFFE